MNLDQVAAVLRSRRGIQSVDLGILLGRRFFGAILRPWLVLAVPLLILVQGAVFWWSEAAFLAILAGWWLKPLFDRITLYVISRGFFGSVPGTKETVRAVLKEWFSLQALLDLSWRRFSPLRTMIMPIRVLEGSRGAMVGTRASGLFSASGRGQGLGLLALALGFKWLFYAGFVALIVILTPYDLGISDSWIDYLFYEASDQSMFIMVLVATTVATTLVEPFFGAGGFGIYIQRRIEREGWDLELRFRKMAGRIEKGLERAAALAMLVLGSLGLSAVLLTTPVHAYVPVEAEVGLAETEVDVDLRPVVRERIPVESPGETVREIKKGPPFVSETETVTRWRMKDFEREREERDHWEPGEFWQTLSLALAEVLRVLIWIAAVIGLLFLLYVLYRRLEGRSGRSKMPKELSRWEEEILSQGGDLSELPDDVVQAARKAWAQGLQRRALALLLLSSLKRFEERHSYRFPDGWTTARCAREVRAKSKEGPVLAAIAQAFDELAWAGRTVSTEHFEVLLERFEAVFAAGSEPGEGHE